MTTNLSSAQVVTRFALRIVVLIGFSAFGSLDFDRSVAALLLLSGCYCVIVAALRQERAFVGKLTHWDEAACYGLLYLLAAKFIHAPA